MEINKVISFVAIIGKIKLWICISIYPVTMQVWQNPATGHSPSRTGRGRVGTSSSSATSSRTSYTWHVTLYTCARDTCCPRYNEWRCPRAFHSHGVDCILQSQVCDGDKDCQDNVRATSTGDSVGNILSFWAVHKLRECFCSVLFCAEQVKTSWFIMVKWLEMHLNTIYFSGLVW